MSACLHSKKMYCLRWLPINSIKGLFWTWWPHPEQIGTIVAAWSLLDSYMSVLLRYTGQQKQQSLSCCHANADFTVRTWTVHVSQAARISATHNSSYYCNSQDYIYTGHFLTQSWLDVSYTTEGTLATCTCNYYYLKTGYACHSHSTLLCLRCSLAGIHGFCKMAIVRMQALSDRYTNGSKTLHDCWMVSIM